jgi:uncharacterized protein YqjF (DUF2071 family)
MLSSMIRPAAEVALAAQRPPRWLLAQQWERLLFAHWPVDARRVRAVLPSSVEPDVHDGRAWVTVVSFLMVGTRSHPGPRWRGLAPIPELNVRTYVRVGDLPAVWFLTLDTTSPLFVTMGRALFGLRYRLARMAVVAEGDAVHFLSEADGAAFSARYAPAGPPTAAAPGTLEHFLVERYRLFSSQRGRLLTARVAHEPWPLQPAAAEITLNRMAPPGLEFRGEPLLHFCRSVSARISVPERVPSYASSPLALPLRAQTGRAGPGV